MIAPRGSKFFWFYAHREMDAAYLGAGHCSSTRDRCRIVNRIRGRCLIAGEDRLRLALQVAPGQLEPVVDFGPVLGPSGLTKFDERLLGSGKVGLSSSAERLKLSRLDATPESPMPTGRRETVAWVTPSRIRFADTTASAALFVCAKFDWKANNNEPS